MDIKVNKIVPNKTEIKKSIAEYLQALLDNGINAIEGSDDYIWVKYEGFSAIRFPEFSDIRPTKDELENVFKKLKCVIINYTASAKNENQANSILYNCYDKSYTLENLSTSGRRDVRLARRNLRIRFASWDEILQNGLKAFIDTRNRVGLSDGNEKSFNNRFTKFSKNPFHRAVAAWFGDEMVAFMSLIIVNDFVIIQGTFSTKKYKKYHPNNGLIDFILTHFLVNNGFSLVCYGLSSVQEHSNIEGLHHYKHRVGFQAIPVTRMFILHPILKPLIGFLRLSLRILLLMFPKNRSLNKASGILSLLKSNSK